VLLTAHAQGATAARQRVTTWCARRQGLGHTARGAADVGMTNEYSKENLIGESKVILAVMTDDSKEELSLVSYLYLDRHRKRVERKQRKMRFISRMWLLFSACLQTVYPLYSLLH
jgi:hypothetical protein